MIFQLLAIQIITFVGVVFLLRFLFSRHLKTALARLNTLHEENLAKEEELNEELKRAKEESKAQIQKGKDEAALIIEAAGKEANSIRLNIQEQAKAQAEKIIAEGGVEAEKLKGSVIKDMRSQSIELASKMIDELLSETDKIALQYEFANDIISEISRLPQEQFNIKCGKVKVSSSFLLLEKQREELKGILAEKIGNQIELAEELNPELIGGLIIDIGGMVIDGTLKNKLQRIIDNMK